jgi:hypothetical protein
MSKKSHKVHKVIKKSKNLFMPFVKWWIIYSISLLLGSFILGRLQIFNSLLNLTFMAFFVAIVAQAVKNHQNHKNQFRFKWFLFYFLVYACVIWIMGEFAFWGVASKGIVFLSIFIGLIMSVVFIVIKKLRLTGDSIGWINFILIILLLVANLTALSSSGILPFINYPANLSEVSEEKQLCPTLNREMPNIRSTADFTPSIIGSKMGARIDTSVWKIEGNTLSCYKGKYRGQYPDWYYCDDMIVSRWDTSSSGTINYRWYTAVSSEWEYVDGIYLFNRFNCENGKKVTVDKDVTNYYVHVTKDGTELRIEY